DRQLGSQLLQFVLDYWRVKSGVEHVVGVTRCRDFSPALGLSLKDYVESRDASGRPLDTILAFHAAHGAAIHGLIPGYRPEDRGNLGHGVLIEYDLGKLHTREPLQHFALAATASAAGALPAPEVVVEETVCKLLKRGHSYDPARSL
ncbi:MAG: hypothetical protein AB7K24_32245, partial [Gemmataceae bacterium]